VPVAKQQSTRVERASIGAQFLTRITRFAQSRVAIEMAVGRDSAFLGSSAITPKLESAHAARESSRAVGAARVVGRELTRAMVAFLGHRIVALVRGAAAGAAPRAPAGHLRPRAALAQERAIGSRANPLVFDSAFPPWAGARPTGRDDRNGDRSEDNGGSRRSSTQVQAGDLRLSEPNSVAS
jgi:hypothetical protein